MIPNVIVSMKHTLINTYTGYQYTTVIRAHFVKFQIFALGSEFMYIYS